MARSQENVTIILLGLEGQIVGKVNEVRWSPKFGQVVKIGFCS